VHDKNEMLQLINENAQSILERQIDIKALSGLLEEVHKIANSKALNSEFMEVKNYVNQLPTCA